MHVCHYKYIVIIITNKIKHNLEPYIISNKKIKKEVFKTTKPQGSIKLFCDVINKDKNQFDIFSY